MIKIYRARTLSEKTRLFKKIIGGFEEEHCKCFISNYRLDSFSLKYMKELGLKLRDTYFFIDKKNILLSKNELKALKIYPQNFLAFHSKVYLFFNKEQAHLIIGNLNLSKEGLTKNIETLIYINISKNQKKEINIILDVFKYFKELFYHNKAQNIYKKNTKNFFLLNYKKEKINSFFIHSLKIPIFYQIKKLINFKEITKIKSQAPVFIEEGDLIKFFLNKQIRIDLILQEKNNNLENYEGNKIKNLFLHKLKTNYLDHSKFIIFYNKNRPIAIFIGSPNFTKSAFFGDAKFGNIESGILIKKAGIIKEFMKHIKIDKNGNSSVFSLDHDRYIDKRRLQKLIKINQTKRLPLTLCWEITSNCQNNCYFCEVRNECESIFQKKKYIKKLLFEAKKIGIISQWITGGEPLLKFELLLYAINIGRKYGIDTEKISTSINFNQSKINKYFEELANSGFTRNELFKGQLNVGIGHQQFDKKGKFRSKQLMTVIKGANNFYKYFDTKRNRIKLSVTESPILTFDNLNKKFLIDNLNPNIKVDHFDAVEEKNSLKTIHAKDFNFDSCFDCSKYFLEPCSWPMIYVRSDGDIYGCITWFLNRQNLFYLGNIKEISLSDAIKKMKRNKILRLLKEDGIKKLYAISSKKFKELKNLKVPSAHNETIKCFICRQILSNKKYISYLNKRLTKSR